MSHMWSVKNINKIKMSKNVMGWQMEQMENILALNYWVSEIYVIRDLRFISAI
jgi:hypothetical protein